MWHYSIIHRTRYLPFSVFREHAQNCDERLCASFCEPFFRFVLQGKLMSIQGTKRASSSHTHTLTHTHTHLVIFIPTPLFPLERVTRLDFHIFSPLLTLFCCHLYKWPDTRKSLTPSDNIYTSLCPGPGTFVSQAHPRYFSTPSYFRAHPPKKKDEIFEIGERDRINGHNYEPVIFVIKNGTRAERKATRSLRRDKQINTRFVSFRQVQDDISRWVRKLFSRV